MKTAIMQPYLFPYIGYFQLINSVDTFVIYDDVNYIKKGWINRNNILVSGKAHRFSINLKEVSQNKRINEIYLADSNKSKTDLLKTIALAYKKAPYFKVVFPLLEEIVHFEENNLAKYLTNSLRKITEYLHLETTIVVSSEIEKNDNLKGQEKILEICRKLQATEYVNAIGGMELYDKKAFSGRDIELKFIKTLPVEYPQFKNEFIPWLSVIDVMLFNPASEIRTLLNQYELI